MERGNELTRLLVGAGAAIDVKNDKGETPLHSAASHGHTEMASLLISAGAGVNVKSAGRFSGNTPLHMAAVDGHNETAQVLVSAGADIHAKNYFKQTPLHQAAWCGRTDTVQWLISVGADVNAKDNVGETPLDKAWEPYDSIDGDNSPYQTRSALEYTGAKRGKELQGCGGCLTVLVACTAVAVFLVIMASH